MKIRFETKIDNIIAFNRFHFANSPAWRRQLWTQTLLMPVVAGVLFLFAFVVLNPIDDADLFLRFLGIFLLLLSIGWVFFIRRHLNGSLERNTRKYLSEGSNDSILGWREMELVNNRLIVNLKLIDSSYDLRAIERIVGDDQYTFVYIGAVQAFIIPMQLYPEDEYRQFVAELSEAWENREAPRPTEEAEPASQPDERIVEGPV